MLGPRFLTPQARADDRVLVVARGFSIRRVRACARTMSSDGFVIELTYGPDVDWYRNITAAGGCVVIHGGTEYQVDRIEPCSTADGLAAFGIPRSLVLRLLRRHNFRRLHLRRTGDGSTGLRTTGTVSLSAVSTP